VATIDVRRLLGGLAALHRDWEHRHIEGLCPPEARYRQNAPAFQAGDTGPNAHPNRELILAGWQVFPDVVPAEISEAVLAVHEDPTGLAEALIASAPPTLVRGDARLENFGLNGIAWWPSTGASSPESVQPPSTSLVSPSRVAGASK
jgi:hypothetical protein